jgi:hypothetical protein
MERSVICRVTCSRPGGVTCRGRKVRFASMREVIGGHLASNKRVTRVKSGRLGQYGPTCVFQMCQYAASDNVLFLFGNAVGFDGALSADSSAGRDDFLPRGSVRCRHVARGRHDFGRLRDQDRHSGRLDRPIVPMQLVRPNRLPLPLAHAVGVVEQMCVGAQSEGRRAGIGAQCQQPCERSAAGSRRFLRMY